jgi:multidrug efflux pump subunit AcrA (membrane-fusion protein)
MHRIWQFGKSRRSTRFRPVVRWWMTALIAAVGPGCSRPATEHKSAAAPPTVHVIGPETRKIVRVVGQPSFVESYERTSIYPKVTGYIEKWNVDIGDKVKKDEELAKLFVPELVEDLGTKKATVELDKERIEQALTIVDVAKADVSAAEARLEEARSILAKYEAQVERWDSEVNRLTREVKKGVVDPQVALESTNQLKASRASRDAAQAAISTAEAELLSKKATLARANVDVDVARADLAVAESEARRLAAWVGYLTLPAPYDGIVVARTANTGDFVLPLAGDPTAMQRAPYLAPGSKAAPIYVVDRIDVVRIFIDIPERDANYVKVGTKASVRIEAFRDDWIPAEVTRTSWALNATSRTLRAEIDLTNTESPKPYLDSGEHQLDPPDPKAALQILPEMYAYARVIIERPNVRALPRNSLVRSGGRNYFWSCVENKAHRNEVQTGVTDGHWVEVIKRRSAADDETAETDAWDPMDGSEQVIVGDLSLLTEGAPVTVSHQDKTPTAAENRTARGAAGSGHAPPPVR